MSVDRARRGTLILTLLASAQFLMTVDSSVMNVSIGTLVDDLDTTVTSIQGVITAYTLVMAAAMITGGKVGDILGRKRTLRAGLVVYAAGSALTAVAPSVGVLLVGWSVLEGLGAALIMPTIVALIAGNFAGKQRAVAYGVIAASLAVAVAAGPIIGGFVTAYFSWRWVFVAEVIIAFGILAGTKIVHDAPPETRPRLDGIGAALSSLGLAMVVFGVLQSSTWGWIEPRVTSGAAATPVIFGISIAAWLVLGGLLVLWVFLGWQRHLSSSGGQPLVDPRLLENRQLRGGLVVMLLQYIVMMGAFFTMPLFLSIVVGLDAFETGLRMLPLSLALMVTAPAVPKLFPRAGPRVVVQAGLFSMLAATVLLAIRFDEGAGAGVTTVPFLLLGAGVGALASPLGNVVVSSVPVEKGGEVGGLQYTAQNLGSSLGTALVGAVVIAGLGGSLLQGIQGSTELDAALKKQAAITVTSGVEFVSDAQLEDALAQTDLTEAEQVEILDLNAGARLDALRKGMVALALFVLLTLFASRSLPARPLVDDERPAPL